MTERDIGKLYAEIDALRRRVDKAETWINRAIIAIMGAGVGAVYLYAQSLGIF